MRLMISTTEGPEGQSTSEGTTGDIIQLNGPEQLCTPQGLAGWSELKVWVNDLLRWFQRKGRITSVDLKLPSVPGGTGDVM